ncbi:hypothetical protein DCCM_3154 [Desulfocucumis palustris]|uniref:Uncharacterized protein n=1 Tax=Desulfocucumis palustris TaxID=1898651 RepID=A0A2L2XEA8_9FIRM|nr:hypothetical protein [Desulfocucumis palustris]GBF34043.1 hypothetical protein DCCM_3154 [Desulfocucumis palustris]
MDRVDELVAELEKLSLEELKELFDKMSDTLDLLGWIKLNEVF